MFDSLLSAHPTITTHPPLTQHHYVHYKGIVWTGSLGQDTVQAGKFWGVLNVSLRAFGTQLGFLYYNVLFPYFVAFFTYFSLTFSYF